MLTKRTFPAFDGNYFPDFGQLSFVHFKDVFHYQNENPRKIVANFFYNDFKYYRILLINKEFELKIDQKNLFQ